MKKIIVPRIRTRQSQISKKLTKNWLSSVNLPHLSMLASSGSGGGGGAYTSLCDGSGPFDPDNGECIQKPVPYSNEGYGYAPPLMSYISIILDRSHEPNYLLFNFYLWGKYEPYGSEPIYLETSFTLEMWSGLGGEAEVHCIVEGSPSVVSTADNHFSLQLWYGPLQDYSGWNFTARAAYAVNGPPYVLEARADAGLRTDDLILGECT